MKTEMTLEEFDELLAVFGSERTRWPLEQRAAAGRLLAQDAQAQHLLAEAQALDRLLDDTHSHTRDLDGLAQRIVASAQRSPRIVSVSPDVAQRAQARASRRYSFTVDSIGVGALVTAASLVLGILIGLSGLPQNVLRPVQQLTGLPIASAQSTPGTTIDTLDEDLL